MKRALLLRIYAIAPAPLSTPSCPLLSCCLPLPSSFSLPLPYSRLISIILPFPPPCSPLPSPPPPPQDGGYLGSPAPVGVTSSGPWPLARGTHHLLWSWIKLKADAIPSEDAANILDIQVGGTKAGGRAGR